MFLRNSRLRWRKSRCGRRAETPAENRRRPGARRPRAPSAPAAGGGGNGLSSGAWSPEVSRVGSIQEELVVQPG